MSTWYVPSAVLGARETVVNSLSPLRIYSLVVKAHICQKILQALVKILEFGCRVLTSHMMISQLHVDGETLPSAMEQAHTRSWPRAGQFLPRVLPEAPYLRSRAAP